MKWIDIVVLVFHVLGATVWTGGHLVLACTVLPRALARRAPGILTDFEAGFERIGLPALGLQFVTGVWLLYRRILDVEGAAVIHTYGLTSLKALLLLLTVGFAAHAKLRLIPKLAPDTMRPLAAHIITVTVLSALFVIVGIGFRVGPQ